MKPYDLAAVQRACLRAIEHAALALERVQAADVHVRRAAQLVRS